VREDLLDHRRFQDRCDDLQQRGYRAMGYLVAEEAISDDGTSPADAGRTSTYNTRNSAFQVEII
jgi:hypothetical protein